VVHTCAVDVAIANDLPCLIADRSPTARRVAPGKCIIITTKARQLNDIHMNKATLSWLPGAKLACSPQDRNEEEEIGC